MTKVSEEAQSERDLLREAGARADRYLEDIKTRRVAPSPETVSRLKRLDEELPREGRTALETLALLDDIGSPNTVASAGGRFFGFVNGGTLPGALAAHVLASAWDQNTALAVMSPIASKLQMIASDWIVDVLRLPAQSSAFFVGSATVANLCGLVAGRDEVCATAGYDVAAKGLRGAPKIRVVAGAASHSTTAKALSICGLGRDCVTKVAVDDQGRMRMDALRALNIPADEPTLLLAQAGEVNSGASDPFGAIADWAQGRNAWIHVDGAFGLWAAASPSKRELVHGLDRCDSWATDGHKWLNVPYDSGIIVVRDAATLRRSMAVTAAYLVEEGAVLEPMNHTPQSSQRGRAIDAWAALRTLGREGLADLIDRTCAHAQRFAEGLQQAGFEVLNQVVLNQVLVSFGSDEATDRVIERLQAGDVCWCGPTVWRGQRAMRISVSSWATTDHDVERCLAAMLEAAA